MRRIVLIFIASLMFLSAFSQALPSKKEQYDFLKWYLKHKIIPPLSDTSEKLLNPRISLQTINQMLASSSKITKADYSYIKKQALQSRSQKIDTGLFKNVHWRTDFHPNSLHRYISIPIFSLDKKVVFIYYNDICGSDCGEESIDAFIKTKNNKWQAANVVVPVIMY